jgi:hypothetical protein
VPSMRVSGEITKPMAEEFFIMLTETCTRVNSETIKRTVKEYTIIRTGPSIRELGKTI